MRKVKFRALKNVGIALVDRYLVSLLIPPFVFGVGLFASLGVAIGNLSDLANKIADSNLPLLAAIEILLLKVPEFATYSLPVSILLATILTYGRLGNDSELIALRSCGASLYRLLVPALCLSFLVAGMTFLLNEYIVPAAKFSRARSPKIAISIETGIFTIRTTISICNQMAKKIANSKVFSTQKSSTEK
jgi:lipopolysaccharide export system permease protein